MEVRSEGPLRAGSLVFRSAGGAVTLTVVAKATFVLTPGESPLVTSGPDAVTAHDVHWDDDPRRSLRCASDLVPFKRSPEVLVVGSAYAPPGRVRRSTTARVAVANVDKAVEVQGERYFDLDGNLMDPASWTRMPLRWELAAGGPGTANPVGVPTGPDAEPDPWNRIRLPHLVPARGAVFGLHDTVPPVGLGPLSPDWPDRRGRLRGQAATWDARTLRERPLPADLDPAYFNAAPADQHMTSFSGDETILLEKLHPEHTRLTTRLARLTPVATLALSHGRGCEIALACDTLWIDTDRGVATLTYRGHAYIQDPAEPGTVIVGLRGSAHRPLESIALLGDVHEDTPCIESIPDHEVIEDDASSHENVESTVTVTGDPTGLGALLPFAPFAAPVAPPDPAAGSPPVAAAPSAAPWPQATFGERLLGGTTTLGQVLQAQAAVAQESPAARPPLPFVPPPNPLSEPPAPPPMLGPLATQPAAVDSTEAPASQPASAAPPASAREVPAEAPPLPVEAFPLGRCAAVTASLDRRPDARGEILQAEGLDDETWGRLAAHWQAAIDKELARHKNGLLRTHDAAYVDRLEEERGPIAAADYARLAMTREASDLSQALSEMGLPAEAWPRIRRVWIARTAKDPKLGAIVRSLMDQEA